jgi:pSer/pThr/pTyr-binding forkhead associated (FHA) protein
LFDLCVDCSTFQAGSESLNKINCPGLSIVSYLPELPMTLPAHEYHLLLINTPTGQRSFNLEAAAYTLGRDQTASIRLNDLSISRHHALLIRMPAPDQQYRYQLVDGNALGQPSTNGTRINGKFISRKVLETGDEIQMGENITASYFIGGFTAEELMAYFSFETARIQSIKSDSVDPTHTLSSEEMTQVLKRSASSCLGALS